MACGKGFINKFRRNVCFAGSSMYTPNAYIIGNEKCRRKNEDSYSFNGTWARDNKAMQNDSFCVYVGDEKPKPVLNLVESLVIEDDCSWFSPPKSCKAIGHSGCGKDDRGDAHKLFYEGGTISKSTQRDCVKELRLIEKGRAKPLPANYSVHDKMKTATQPHRPLMDIQNRTQITKKKKVPTAESITSQVNQHSAPLNRTYDALTKQTNAHKDVSNTHHSTNKKLQSKTLKSPAHTSPAAHTKIGILKQTKRGYGSSRYNTLKHFTNSPACVKNPKLALQSFIGMVNGPKPHVVLSETVRKGTVKGKRMFCAKLHPGAKSMQDKYEALLSSVEVDTEEQGVVDENKTDASLATEVIPNSSDFFIDKHMELAELDTTKMMQEHALKEPVLAGSDDSVAISTHLKLTMSMSSIDTTNVNSVRVSSSVDSTLDVSQQSSHYNYRAILTGVVPKEMTSKTDTDITNNKRTILLSSQLLLDIDKLKEMSPTLAKLKRRKQKSVSKLVMAFEHLGYGEDSTAPIVDDVDTPSPVKKTKYEPCANRSIQGNKIRNGLAADVDTTSMKSTFAPGIACPDVKEAVATENSVLTDLNDIIKISSPQLLINGTIGKTAQSLCNHNESMSCLNVGTPPSSNFKGANVSVESTKNGNTVVCNVHSFKIPDKLSSLWQASMLDNFQSRDFTVSQGNDVIVMNDDRPKWLYVQVANAVNGRTMTTAAGFVPRSLVLPKFASPATRRSYRSLRMTRKTNNSQRCHKQALHCRRNSGSTRLIPVEKENKEWTSEQVQQQEEEDIISQPVQSLPLNALIELYVILCDHKPVEEDEVEVFKREVIVVHATQQRELDWMWVYVPRLEAFGYIPAFNARPLTLESAHKQP